MAGSAAAVSPLVWNRQSDAASFQKTITVDQLSTFQKEDMRKEMLTRCLKVLREKLTAEDAAACMRLVLLDAGTYDIKAKTGGMNGSVITSDELSAEDKKALGDVIKRLKEAKAEIGKLTEASGTGQGNISWADLLVLAGKVAVTKEWRNAKVVKSGTEDGGKLIADSFGTAFVVKLGRLDSTEADSGLIVPCRTASTDDIKTWLSKLGNRKFGEDPGFLAPKPPFWERPGFVLWTAGQLDPKAAEEYLAEDPGFADFKKKYDASRRTVTRTDYEVDFVDYYNKLTSYATFDPLAYCFSFTVSGKL